MENKNFHLDIQERLLVYESQGFKIIFDFDKEVEGMGYEVHPEDKSVQVRGLSGDFETFKTINFSSHNKMAKLIRKRRDQDEQ
jgi:hypothetical protein